ncbi:hypothetical protein SAMN05216226_10767 [Halovenus aranensis]|uniref:Zn-ribbon containing protein n=1 Tax=Halovenus aranensis TaxID=890420 RepID=A0A1G8VPD3_9EURY|nr:Zn-ribbon containing protein [Halovenus aranensis]SDJ67823.1 hypothetical protein SAMN05216226_10767 [Halovenus aranensis]
MPHECTDCGRAFDDGSKEMLSGCPDCGGNTFQFRPDGDGQANEAATPPEPPEPEGNSTVARTVGSAATVVRDLVGADDSPEYPTQESTPTAASSRDGPPETSGSSSDSSHIAAESAAHEDAAQASARSEVVSPEDLPETAPSQTRESTAAETADQQSREDRPDLEELREQLNEQFESIRVVAPGQYELNLMELYDREEYIIALQEDGKYTIQVPERWSE